MASKYFSQAFSYWPFFTRPLASSLIALALSKSGCETVLAGPLELWLFDVLYVADVLGAGAFVLLLLGLADDIDLDLLMVDYI
jgi:hypothetical protein